MVPLEKFPEYTERPAGKPLALQGLRVADFSRLLAGPFCTQTLGDLGAEVIKIESFAGDDCRAYVPPSLAGEGAFYLSTNRNKKSICLDLKNEVGKQIALDIISSSDILVENFSNGVMDRLGFSYEAVKAINPKIIYCAISAYGRDDKSVPARTGFDAMFQASSGFMSLTGEPGGHPMRTTVPVIDAATAMMATNAICAALGYVMLQQRAVFNTPGVFAILILLMIIGSALHMVMATLERKVVFWSQETSETHL